MKKWDWLRTDGRKPPRIRRVREVPVPFFHKLGEEICVVAEALDRARAKLQRLANAGFVLSRNDRRIALMGQLLCAVEPGGNVDELDTLVERVVYAR